jgi:hypothetical protein
MERGRELLKGMYELLDETGVLIFSTPIYCDSFKMAKNHINELRKAEIESELHDAGFVITKQYGTFGNYNHLKKVMTHEERLLYDTVGEFYSNDLLGCFLSPKYPEAARNITHVCMKDISSAEPCELKDSIV